MGKRRVKFLLFLCLSAGLVSEPTGKMAEKGEYKERSGAACPQLPPDHLQWRAHGSRGDRAAGAGARREEEAEAGAEAAEVTGQTAPG